MAVATAEIDLAALLHNFAILKKKAANSKIIAILKANAYGHGMLAIAAALQGQSVSFGVARLDEALQLRTQGVLQPILLLEGISLGEDLSLLERYSLQTVVHCPEQVARLASFIASKPITVWFKLDSGMHRLGFRLEEALPYFIQLHRCQSVAKPIHILSHFCRADEVDDPYTFSQIGFVEKFLSEIAAKEIVIGDKSLAASGAIFAWPDSHCNFIRPGISLYGVSPFSYHTTDKVLGAQLGLKTVMTLKSELIAVRNHRKGEGVGYNHVWRSRRDTQLGVVAMGYGDGYPRRSIRPGTTVLVNGRRSPIVGRVSMDMTVIDLGPNNDARIGDEVIFWGPALPIEEIAGYTGLSAYELLTSLTGRVSLVYK